MSAINKQMNLHEWLLLIALSVLWGGSFFFVGVSVTELPTLTITLLRVAVAAMVLWLVIAVLRVPVKLDRKLVVALLIMGLLNNVIPFSFIVWGQNYISSGMASVLNATTPIFTVVVAHRFLADERLSIGKLCGVLIGFFGVAVMFYPAVVAGTGSTIAGQLAILVATLSYGFAAVHGRKFVRMNVSPLVTAAGQLTASSLLLLPVTLFVDQPWNLPMPSSSVMLSMFGLAVFSTALAYLLYFRILASSGATNAALVTLLVPVTATFLGFAFLDEIVSAWQLGGMLWIGAGFLVIDGRLFRRSTAT